MIIVVSIGSNEISLLTRRRLKFEGGTREYASRHTSDKVPSLSKKRSDQGKRRTVPRILCLVIKGDPMPNMVPGLSILIISFTALIARSFPQDQHLIPHFLPHGMQPIISTLRSRKGVCMSKSEKVPFLHSRSELYSRSGKRQCWKSHLRRKSLENFLFRFGFHKAYPRSTLC
jgi:hypothetical protein